MRTSGVIFACVGTLLLGGLVCEAHPSPDVSQSLDPGTVASDAGSGELSQDQLAAAAQHIADSLPNELYDNFQLFIYVSKAETGPWAQHMFVLQKQADDSLQLVGDWPVSTGRERVEYNGAGKELPSFTPQGYYELDPKRMFADYTSMQWGEPMPYAMFFQWKQNGRLTGLAIHAATNEEIGELGMRASAGCIRLHPDAAQRLFELVRSQYRGAVPVFETDPAARTTNNSGALSHKPDGSLQLEDGYKVLVFVEDYGGDSAIASAR